MLKRVEIRRSCGRLHREIEPTEAYFSINNNKNFNQNHRQLLTELICLCHNL